jgi:hypothetical protein
MNLPRLQSPNSSARSLARASATSRGVETQGMWMGGNVPLGYNVKGPQTYRE